MSQALLILTESLPCKTIIINGEPYLERYYLKTDEDGTQHWLHRFLRSDAERHLHTHPWTAESTLLCGWYEEEREYARLLRCRGNTHTIKPDTLHRIAAVQPDTWTYLRVQPERESQWFFVDDDGNKVAMDTSPVDWWKGCQKRGEK